MPIAINTTFIYMSTMTFCKLLTTTEKIYIIFVHIYIYINIYTGFCTGVGNMGVGSSKFNGGGGGGLGQYMGKAWGA